MTSQPGVVDNVPLPLLASGKVRELYALPTHPDALLFVASDRISAYDVVLTTGIPNKGSVLTQLSAYWFRILAPLVSPLLPDSIPFRHHFLHLGVPQDVDAALTPSQHEAMASRSMTVRRLRILPIEAIVRGYIAGSAWKEYCATGTIHGISLPAGLKQCSRIPDGPLYTPSTKAPAGQHDENIHPDRAVEILGGDKDLADKVAALAKAIYSAAAKYAEERGIIIADTKFEFGVDDATGEVVLVDEVLTPDSSRFWPLDRYEEGRDQDSFDKQILRNWLTESGLKGKHGISINEAIAKKTEDRYRDAFRMITGKTLEEVIASAQ